MDATHRHNVLLEATDGATALAPVPSAERPDPYGHLPPPTKSQIAYWRELAGVLNLHGSAGVRDEDWPADLAPPEPTLRAMVERGVITRRHRAWHLRRDWYRRLTDLKGRAVPTPSLHLAERPAPHLPTYAELHAWEAICRWLDGQPRQRARLPFADLEAFADEGMALGELPTAHLKAMRKYRLVRHTAGCAWALSSTWRDRLNGLWRGMERARREAAPVAEARPTPRSLVAGIDTWYLNWRVEEAVPARLRRDLDDYQGQAKEEEQEVDTRWAYDGAPLRMYRSGTKPQTGKGVSWTYVLINPSLRLLIRRKPLGGIVAQARLGSECLWRLTDRRALDELDALIRRMWGKQQGHWQVSQVHLAHDVVNAPIDEEQLERVVSRSRRQATYAAAKADLAQLLQDLRGEDEAEDAPFLLDWDALYAEDAPGWAGWEEGETEAPCDEPAEDRALTAHRWGKRLSGVTWSPGGATSFVEYDKVLESRFRGKRTMEPLWKAAGWDGEASVTRFEARLRREPLRELRPLGTERCCLDDPWEFLEHKQEVWAAMVGRADETCPEAVDVAWIRRVVPAAGDTNRSRWDTDSTWHIVQAAPFANVPARARRLVRRKQRLDDVKVLDADLYGLLVSRVALLHPQGERWDLSMALGEAARALEVIAARPEKDFGALVRARRQARGLPVEHAERVLPLPVSPPLEESPEDLAALDADLPVAEGEWAAWRAQRAERRMREAFFALEDAERRGASRRTLDRLEEAFAQETCVYDATVAPNAWDRSIGSPSHWLSPHADPTSVARLPRQLR